jgi:hypothetical protein
LRSASLQVDFTHCILRAFPVWEHFFDGAINQIWIWEAELLAAERMKDVATEARGRRRGGEEWKQLRWKTKW